MVGKIRTSVVLLMVALATLVLAPLVWIGLRTGLFEGRGILRIWHRVIAAALGFLFDCPTATVAGELPAHRLRITSHPHRRGRVAEGAPSPPRPCRLAAGLGGRLSRLQRTVFIEREQRRKSGQQAGEIAGRLAKGDAMVLFAEGTTGDGNVLLPFKSTLFGAASMMLAAGKGEIVWVQPVAIAYTRVHGLPMGRQHRPIAAWIGDQDLVPHLRGLLARPVVDVELHFGVPVPFHAGGAIERR